jgi:hypothetical protein
MEAHLNELLYSINMLFQSYLNEHNHESINLRIVMTSLYEFIKNKDINTLNKSIKEIGDITQNIIDILNKNKTELDNLLDSNEDKDFKRLFMQGLTYSYGKMAKSLSDVIITQRYFNQYYSIEDFEAEAIKKFLKIVSLFLDKFLELILPA